MFCALYYGISYIQFYEYVYVSRKYTHILHQMGTFYYKREWCAKLWNIAPKNAEYHT